MTGAAVAKNVPIDEEMPAIYARLIAGSRGDISIDLSLFTNDEFEFCKDRLHITSEMEEELGYRERSWGKVHYPPPKWWLFMDKEMMNRKREPNFRHRHHVNCLEALQYVRDHPVREHGWRQREHNPADPHAVGL